MKRDAEPRKDGACHVCEGRGRRGQIMVNLAGGKLGRLRGLRSNTDISNSSPSTTHTHTHLFMSLQFVNDSQQKISYNVHGKVSNFPLSGET